MTADEAQRQREIAERERRDQGLPPKVNDAGVLARIVTSLAPAGTLTT